MMARRLREKFKTANGASFPIRSGGQALVEFAIVLPFLLLVMFGITEFGRAYYQYNTLSKAIRNGARYLSSNTYSSANLTNTQNLVVYGNTAGSGPPMLPGLTPAMINITPSGGATPYDEINPPQYVNVAVNNYAFSSLVPGIISLNVTFSPQVTFRYVGPNARL
ncbi:MAG: TadE family protein [Terriglobia bacterium]